MSSKKQERPVLFTQEDVVTVFAGPPPASPFGVRVGTVKGAIRGTVAVNTLLKPSPPGASFTGDDRALVIDTDGDQILFKVTSEGSFIKALTSPPNDPPPGRPTDFIAPVPWSAPLNLAGHFDCTYSVIQGTGKYANLTGAFQGVGIAILPAHQADPTKPQGVAFTTVFGSLSLGTGNRGGRKPRN
jgi:hypothetical protein